MSASLLGHLIRPLQERRRDRQAEGLRGLEVDDQLDVHWLLDGEVCGLDALQDLVNVPRGATVQRRQVRPIAHQGAVLGKLPCKAQRRQLVGKGKLHNTAPLSEEQLVEGDQKYRRSSANYHTEDIVEFR